MFVRPLPASVNLLFLLLAHQLCNRRLHRLCPYFVALGVGVQKIRHDVLGEFAIFGKKMFVDVKVMDHLAVGDFGCEFAGFCVLFALRARLRRPREDRQYENLRLRQFLPQLRTDSLDPVADFFRRIILAVGVIGADHNNGEFGIDTVDLTMIETPQHMLRPVAAETQVGSLARCVILRPHLLAAAFPAVSNRIADHKQIHIALGDTLQHRLMAKRPPTVTMSRIYRRMLFRLGNRKTARQYNRQKARRQKSAFHHYLHK